MILELSLYSLGDNIAGNDPLLSRLASCNNMTDSSISRVGQCFPDAQCQVTLFSHAVHP